MKKIVLTPSIWTSVEVSSPFCSLWFLLSSAFMTDIIVADLFAAALLLRLGNSKGFPSPSNSNYMGEWNHLHMEVFLWDLQVKLAFDRFLWRGSILQTKDMCFRARLSQDNIEHMLVLLTMGAEHTRTILYTLTTHKYTDLGILPTAISSMEGCGKEIKNGRWRYMPSPTEYFLPLSVEHKTISKYLWTMNTLQNCVCHTSQENSTCGKSTASSVYTTICFVQILLLGAQSTIFEELPDTGQQSALLVNLPPFH